MGYYKGTRENCPDVIRERDYLEGGEGRNYRYSVSERKRYIFSQGKEKLPDFEERKGDLDPCPTPMSVLPALDFINTMFCKYH